MAEKRLTIFVHRASERLTDHEPHGDGLICFSLLNGLAERGHRIFAYTNHSAIHACSPRLQVRSESPRMPINSLVSWEHARRAERWLQEVAREQQIDLVWRMHPYSEIGQPNLARLLGKPLVVGPLFYPWPAAQRSLSQRGRPRFGVGLGRLITPVARRGWARVLQKAALLICSTPQHAAQMRRRCPGTFVIDLPVIVEKPSLDQVAERERSVRSGSFRLIFVANLLPYKNPLLFCEIVKRLRDAGLNVEGTLVGDGPELPALEDYCRAHELQNAICFAGKLPNIEVYRRMMAADLLVSLSIGEPYGRSIAEAMSVGVPCICHRSGGPADFITDHVDGLLIDALDAGFYADAISRLYADPALRQTLSVNAMAKAEEWTADAVLTRLERHLLEVAGGQK